MGILSMVITIFISGICGMFLLEKTKIKERLLKFDSENSGPIYNVIKGVLFIFLNIVCFGCSFASYFIFNYIIQEQYTDAIECFVVAFLSGIVFCFVISTKN